jgi:selenide,water dikinase
MGRIGAANVLSDMYSAGVVNIDSVLMILASSEDIKDIEIRNTVTRLMMKGFSDCVIDAGSKVQGGQSVRNPWPIIGGVASSVVTESQMILPVNAVPGDLVVLTKPLGTQVAVNVHHWITNKNPKYASMGKEIIDAVGLECIESAYQKAASSMSRLNRNAAKLMHVHGAHAATDVTGFGLIGHAANLAQENHNIAIVIDTLPVIKGTVQMDEIAGYALTMGFSSETSGGVLVCLPPEKAKLFCDEIYKADGFPAWIVGRVVEKLSTDGPFATIIDDPKVIDY